uniref:Uncharacterized protein n=1 Tax=Romanomermis culicivorax TaxID=13658 RepID=A0A915IUV8_ROMCU
MFLLSQQTLRLLMTVKSAARPAIIYIDLYYILWSYPPNYNVPIQTIVIDLAVEGTQMPNSEELQLDDAQKDPATEQKNGRFESIGNLNSLGKKNSTLMFLSNLTIFLKERLKKKIHFFQFLKSPVLARILQNTNEPEVDSHCLNSDYLPEDLKQAKKIVSLASQFTIKDEISYYLGDADKDELKLEVPVSKKEEVLEACHDDIG